MIRAILSLSFTVAARATLQKSTAFLSLGEDFLCPHVLPIGEGDDKKSQEPYFEKLHEIILDGNKVLEGIEDNTFREHFWKEYEEEIKCVFTVFLDDKQEGGPCGGLESRFDTRQMMWEKLCLSPDKDVVDVYDIMEKDEKTYFFSPKRKMKETA